MSETKLCKNCNSKLIGFYCFECGQKDTQLLSVKEIVREFTDNVFSFDSRFFITLKYLITKPGFLTTEYWSGKRTTYLPPLRLYLVLSVLYFFITSTTSEKEVLFEATNDGEKVPFSIRIDESEPEIFHFFVNTFNEGLIIVDKKQLNEQDILFSTLPSAMFILMPFMGVLFFLLYKKRKLFYSYHLITVLHFHCFVFLIYSIEELIPFFQLLLPLIFLYYSVSMLKRIYMDSWIKTSMKFIILFITYGTTVALTVLVISFGKIFLIGYYP